MTKRFLMVIPTIFLAIFISFSILLLTPGDPVLLLLGPKAPPEAYEKLRTELGLDLPLHVQYFRFLCKALTGDFGRSLYTHEPVLTMIMDRLPKTIELMVAGLIMSMLLAIPFGVISAIKQGSIIDRVLTSFSLLFYATPSFCIGLIFIYFFSMKLRLFPIGGSGDIRYLILPALVLGLSGIALPASLVKSGLIEVLSQDFILSLRARGLSERTIIYKHALRHALISFITLLGLNLGWIVGGSVVIEMVFARPGIGTLLITAIRRRDYPVVQGIIFLLSFFVVIGNLIADILYALVDPRIRYR